MPKTVNLLEKAAWNFSWLFVRVYRFFGHPYLPLIYARYGLRSIRRMRKKRSLFASFAESHIYTGEGDERTWHGVKRQVCAVY